MKPFLCAQFLDMVWTPISSRSWIKRCHFHHIRFFFFFFFFVAQKNNHRSTKSAQLSDLWMVIDALNSFVVVYKMISGKNTLKVCTAQSIDGLLQIKNPPRKRNTINPPETLTENQKERITLLNKWRESPLYSSLLPMQHHQDSHPWKVWQR